MKRTAKILSMTDACKAQYLKPDGNPYKEGEIIKNDDYAAVLEEIGRSGNASFYNGSISGLIEKEMKDNDGFLTSADLKAYSAIRKKPAKFEFLGNKVITAPPPSTGSLVFSGLRALMNLTEQTDHQELLARAMLKMFSERRRGLGTCKAKEPQTQLSLLKQQAFAH